MIDSVMQENINKWLLRDFGRSQEKPLFRVILATPQVTEVRQGEFNEFHGDIFIRSTIGTQRTEKYNYLDHVYVLERFYGVNDENVKEGDGYEPIFVFHNQKKDIKLPLRYDVAKVYALASLVAKPRMTGKMLRSAEEEHQRKVTDKRMDMIGQELSWMSHLFHHKEAVIQPGTGDYGKSPNLKGDVK